MASEHLVHLSGHPWGMWRWVALRSAGFPIQQVLELSTPESAAAADRCIQAQASLKRAQDEALRVAWQLQRQAAPEQRKVLRKTIHLLEGGRVPAGAVAETLQEPIEALARSKSDLQALEAEYQRTFHLEISRIDQTVHAAARDPRFREALLWQNRHALSTGVDSLLRNAPSEASRPSKQRYFVNKVTKYLQRYCAKNDTIGFFGPVGWATATTEGAALNSPPADFVLEKRTVHFEEWCIDALAEHLAKEERFLPWMAPRRLPHVGLDGAALHLPFTPPLRLPPSHAAVLRACDGERTARQLARDLVHNPASGLKSEGEVFDVLRQLRSRNRIAWTFEIPAEGLHPERQLRKHLERIEDEADRGAALKALDELEAARDAVAGASSDVERLGEAMDALDRTFTHHTGAAPTRRAGQTYAGRTLVYEDCRRRLDLTLGPRFFEALAPPLALILTSARWFTFQAAELYRKAFLEVHRDLARQGGSGTLAFSEFWLWIQPLLFGENFEPVDRLVEELQARWARILSVPEGPRRVEYASRDLGDAVQEAFAAPRPGWASAHHHSPDVMIAASSPQAINDGDYLYVMGELHPGDNTLAIPLFAGQHPTPDALLRAMESDLPKPRVIPMTSREVISPVGRMGHALVSPKDFRLLFAHDSCGVPRSRALPIGDLLVEEGEGTLQVRTRDGRFQEDIIELVGEFLMMRVVHAFDMVPLSGHGPRISFDRLVVRREAWQFLPEELGFAQELDEAQCLLQARKWAEGHGMPRFVFAKIFEHSKPFYVDFAGSTSLGILAKAVRQAAQANAENPSSPTKVTLTEMLPNPEQTWLTDSRGQSYSCEFRMVAVDLQGRDRQPA